MLMSKELGEKVSLTEGEVEQLGPAIDAQFEARGGDLDEYWQDTGGYTVFSSHPAGVGDNPPFTQVLDLRVWGGEPPRYQIVGYAAGKEGRSEEVICAEGSGDLETFLREQLGPAAGRALQLNDADITIPWPYRHRP